jgi:hypothetical protein
MGATTSLGRNPRARALGFGVYILLAIILLVATALRWYGLAWDDGYLFHPDERQILLVASNLNIPHKLTDFFSTSSSLNPHFFAYGSFPIYLLRILAPFAPPINITGPWADDSLVRWIVFARSISGVFDLGAITLIFLLGKRLYSPGVGIIAAACVAVSVLHIQLSHFYAVDTLLTFLVLATLYAALRLAEQPTRFWKMVCGVTYGLALATKVSALPLIFPIAFAIWRAHWVAGQNVIGERDVWARHGAPLEYVREVWRGIRRPLLGICGVAVAVFILTQPYALID